MDINIPSKPFPLIRRKLAMPIIDSEIYSHLNTEYILPLIDEIVSSEGRKYQECNIFYFNIYLGSKFYRLGDEIKSSHVCRKMEFGLIFAVFHEVRRGDVLICTNEKIADQVDSCITLIWTADKPSTEHIAVCITFADEIVRNIELATGLPCPIPLNLLQVPSTFEIACFNVAENKTYKTFIYDENHHLPIIHTSLAPRIYALQGFDDQFNELKSPVMALLDIAARWQQRAIRAFGTHEWADCVIAANTWIEVFSVQITLELNKNLEHPIVDPRSTLSRGLPKFINNHLGSKILKGRWDSTDLNSEFGEWCQKCYELRHKIVHLGYLPTEQEAKDAYDTAHRFAKFLTKKIASLKDHRLSDMVRPLKEMSGSFK